jgi:protein TonB
MEPKKNPKYDIHRQRGLLYNISLAISILLVIGMFKITMPYRDASDPPPPDDPEMTYYVEPDVKSTRHQKPTIKKEELVRVTNAVNFVAVESEPTTAPESPQVDMGIPDLLDGLSAIPVELPEAPITFRIVEKMPEPVGGWPAFYQMLQRHMKYPPRAIRNNAKGKVFIEYTINEQGQPIDITIIKGIGYGCDEEAQRIIQLTKWNPGKQRGKPVRVRMAQAIEFRLR